MTSSINWAKKTIWECLPLYLFENQLDFQRMRTTQGQGMELCEQIKDLIEFHFSKYPHLSINAFSLKSGVPATTLRRILSNSTKGDPAPHTVLNIVSALTNEKRISSLIEKYPGPIQKTLNETFGPYLESMKDHCVTSDFSQELKDPIKYFIYKLAANRSGVKRKYLYKLFGRFGIDKSQELIEKKLLFSDYDILHAKEKNFALDYKIAAGHLPELVKFYKSEQVQLGQNLFYTLSESVNEEAINEIKKIQKDAIQKIFEIFGDQKYKGDIHYFTLNLSDTIDYGRTEEMIQ